MMDQVSGLTADLLDLLGSVFHQLVPSSLICLEDVERLGVLLLGLLDGGLDGIHCVDCDERKS